MQPEWDQGVLVTRFPNLFLPGYLGFSSSSPSVGGEAGSALQRATVAQGEGGQLTPWPESLRTHTHSRRLSLGRGGGL